MSVFVDSSRLDLADQLAQLREPLHLIKLSTVSISVPRIGQHTSTLTECLEEFYRMKLYAAEYLHPRTETPAKKLERLETLTPVSASPEPHASSLQRTHSPTAESNLASSCQSGKRSLDQPWAEEAACTRYEDQAPENSVKESLVGDCRDEQACLSEVGNDEAGEWESVIESDLVETWTEVQKSWKCGGSWEQVKSKMRKRSWIN